MDAHDLFRKLGAGAKFDFKRFRSDAEKLKIKSFAPSSKPSDTVELPANTNEDHNLGTSRKRHLGQRQRNKNKRKRTLSEGSLNDEEENKTPVVTERLSDDDLSHSEEEDQDEAETAINLLGGMKAKETEEVKLNKRQRKKLKKSKKKTSTLLAALEQEKVNSFRNKHRIHTYGEDVPDPVAGFTQLSEEYSVHSQMLSNIQALGYSNPTPIQSQAIPVMLHNRELLACAPTGSGKTVAFLLPVLHHLKEPMRKGIRALILSPTRELANQTYRECCRLAEGRGFRIHHASKATSDKVISSKKYDILITTPNRLVYMLNHDPPLINLQRIEWLIIDESDKLFEEGKQGFRDQMATIYNACDSKNVRRALFSATCSYDVEEWCRLNLDNLVSVYIGARNSANETVEQELLFVGNESGKLLAVRDIFRKGFHPPVLIFVQSKERAKELFRELIYDGINVDVIHADRTQTERDNVVKGFRSGAIWVLICTELMGRGIDFVGVNLVINYDFPTSSVAYIHRIGRTGRAGHKGKAITFFTEEDSVLLRSIANVMREAGCPVPEYMLGLKKPNKKTRKKLSKRAPKRESISTAPKSQYQKARDKYRLASKKKKEKTAET